MPPTPLFARIAGVLAGLFGLSSVALGAYGRHAIADPYIAELYEIGTHYQITHALALLAVAVLMHLLPAGRRLTAAGLCFAVGIVLFCGTLYLAPVAMITGAAPAGGWLMMLGWVLLALAFVPCKGAQRDTWGR